MKKLIIMMFLIALLATTVGSQTVTWEQMLPAQPFSWAACGVLGNYFYTWGGDFFGPFGQAFNLTTREWTMIPSPITIEWGDVGSVATDSAIYLIGGFNIPVPGDSVRKFIPDPATGGPLGAWTQLAPYPMPVYAPAAAWDGGNYIYVAGGGADTTGTAVHSRAYRYDIGSNAWTQLPNMPVATGWCGGAFIQGKFYVVGGLLQGNLLQEYNPGQNSWMVKASPPLPVHSGLYATSTNGNLLFTVGGGHFAQPSNAVQIYNPLTDNWTQETSLPELAAINSTGFIPPNKIISAGGDPWGVCTGSTHLGEGFPLTLPSIEISLSPVNPPIQIPPGGGNFSYNATMNNPGAAPSTFDIWIMVQLPNLTWYGPALGPVNLTLGAGSSVNRMRTQSVPAGAPAGNYTYEGRVGSYPAAIWNSDSFPFTKSATGDAGLSIGAWACTGESFPGEQSVNALTPSVLEIKASPNPFNPTTVLSYQLPVASRVNLRIYNTVGRLVTELVNGWREAGEHQIAFDGSGLPSGIYFAKLKAGDCIQLQKIVLMK